MPRRSPPPLDTERVRALLAVGRAAAPLEVPGSRGWLPEGAPPDADTTWADEPATAEGEVAGEPERSAGRHRPGPRVLTVPVAFRGARLTVSWRAVLAAVLLLVAAGVVFAVRVARAEQAAVPEAVGATGGLAARTTVPPAFASAAASGTGASGAAAGGSAAASAAPTGVGSARGSPTSARPLVIDVVGQVVRPGVVSVADGSRVSDVLAAAGGALPSADLQRLNLARLVSDGEQVFVPKPGENPPAPVGVVGGGAGSAGSAGSAVSGGASGAVSGVPVDINAATLGDLDSLPGVGPVLAQRILDWRAAHGRFSSVDELGEVSGIGDKLLAQIRPRVRVS